MKPLMLTAAAILISTGAAYAQQTPAPSDDPAPFPVPEAPDAPMPGDPIPADPLPGDPIPGDPVPGGPLPGDPLPGDPVPGDTIPEAPAIPADPGVPSDGALSAPTAEELTGATVLDLMGERVGTVGDLQLNGDAVTGVIIDVGGFLGFGAKPVLVPIDAISVLRDADGSALHVETSLTREDLDVMPEYTAE